jgi:hypothetical protein
MGPHRKRVDRRCCLYVTLYGIGERVGVRRGEGRLLTDFFFFFLVALIYTLRVPLGFIPAVIGGIVESRLSLARIQAFLMADEMDTAAIEKVPLPDSMFPLAIGAEVVNTTAIEITSPPFVSHLSSLPSTTLLPFVFY